MTSSYPDLDMHERAWVAGKYVHTTGDKNWFHVSKAVHARLHTQTHTHTYTHSHTHTHTHIHTNTQTHTHTTNTYPATDLQGS